MCAKKTEPIRAYRLGKLLLFDLIGNEQLSFLVGDVRTKYVGVVVTRDYGGYIAAVLLIMHEIVGVVGHLNVHAGVEQDCGGRNLGKDSRINGIEDVVGYLDVLRRIYVYGVSVTVIGELTARDSDVIDGQGVIRNYGAGSLDAYWRLIRGYDVVIHRSDVVEQTLLNENVLCYRAFCPFGLAADKYAVDAEVSKGTVLYGYVSRLDKEAS